MNVEKSNWQGFKGIIRVKIILWHKLKKIFDKHIWPSDSKNHKFQVVGPQDVDGEALGTQVSATDDKCDRGLRAKGLVDYGLGGQVFGSKDLGSKSSYSELDHR